MSKIVSTENYNFLANFHNKYKEVLLYTNLFLIFISIFQSMAYIQQIYNFVAKQFFAKGGVGINFYSNISLKTLERKDLQFFVYIHVQMYYK